MVVLAMLILAAAALIDAAIANPLENPGITTIGSKKLGTAVDCAGAVAFSAIHASMKDSKLIFSETMIDKGVGYAAETGIFTTHCPGLYQFTFVGHGTIDLELTLKLKLNKSNEWKSIINGAANLVLLDVDVGDQLAIFVESGNITKWGSFTGYRIYKK